MPRGCAWDLTVSQLLNNLCVFIEYIFILFSIHFFLYKILDGSPQIQTHYIIRLFTKNSTKRDDRYIHHLKQGLLNERLNRTWKSVVLRENAPYRKNESKYILNKLGYRVFKFIEIANASSSSSLLMHYELRLNIYSFSINLTPWVPIISARF